jgi:hypothetical protein
VVVHLSATNARMTSKGRLLICDFDGVKCMIDTGADADVTTRGFVEKGGFRRNPTEAKVSIIMANEGKLQVKDTTSITLTRQGKPVTIINPLVMEIDGRVDFDVIIGRKTQERLGMTILAKTW